MRSDYLYYECYRVECHVCKPFYQIDLIMVINFSTCENNGTHKWNKTGSYQDMGSEHDSGSAVGSTTNMESPFSIRYAYPSLFRRNATLQKRRPPSVAARHETSMDSSFNDSGNTYAQLVFNSSTLKVTKGTDAVDSQNVVTRKSATYGPDQSNTDVFKSSNLASEKKAAVSIFLWLYEQIS